MTQDAVDPRAQARRAGRGPTGPRARMLDSMAAPSHREPAHRAPASPVGTPGPAAPAGRHDLLGLGDQGLQALLFLALLLLLWSWSRLEGYQIADAVEYLERADALTRRGGTGAAGHGDSIRSFGFSGLLIPLFALADLVEWLTGFQRRVLIVHAARLLQIAMTLGLIATTARIAAGLGGRGAGYAAGALMTVSPTVLQWGVSPVSGVAAALLIALSIELLVVDAGRHGPRRRGWLAGLGLGGGFLMAYQTIVVVAPIFLLIFLRRRARPVVDRGMVVAGVAVCVLLQMVLDRFYYGEFGKSVVYYFVLNVGSIVPLWLHGVGEHLGFEPLKQVARWLYNQAGETLGVVSSEQRLLDSYTAVSSKLPRNWYLTHMHTALTWPGVALLATGVGFVIYKRARMPLSLLVIAGVNIAAMSEKGSKEFRLWLPFLSMLAVLAGLGFRAFAGNSRRRLCIGIAALLAALALGVAEHAARGRTRYGAFWRAIAWINTAEALERAAMTEGREPPATRVSSSFHWGVLLRESRDVELVKLPTHIDHWEAYDEASRTETLATLRGLGWFVAHLPALTNHPELLAAVARDFAVAASFYDRLDGGDFGPVLVFRRRTGGEPEAGELVLFEARGLDEPPPEPARWAAERGFGRPVQFGFGGELLLLGTEFDRLPGDGHGWVTYQWHGVRTGRDVTIIDRITSPLSPWSWHNNHRPAYGLAPTSEWPTGRVATDERGRPLPFAAGTRQGGLLLTEGYLVIPEADPFRPDGPERFIGGPYMAGDLVPGELWVDVGRLSPDGEVIERLPAVRPTDGVPLAVLTPPLSPTTPDGWRTSADGMTRVGSFLIPITERQRARAGRGLARARPRSARFVP